MVAAGKGSIINIASISSILPLSRVVAYSASKAAVLNLTQWLAREWATRGVRVNAITPGFFPAEQNRRMLLKDDGTYTERGQSIVGHTPMGRFGEAHELAGAVVWLWLAFSARHLAEIPLPETLLAAAALASTALPPPKRARRGLRRLALEVLPPALPALAAVGLAVWRYVAAQQGAYY